jgi:hypothetical protein
MSASTVPYAYVKIGAAFSYLPHASTNQIYREIPATSCGISGNVAHKFRFLPAGNVMYELDNFGALKLNGVTVPGLDGQPIDCTKTKGLVVTLTPYDPLIPVTGGAEVTYTDLFLAGSITHPLNVGDVMALTNAIGFPKTGATGIVIESAVGSANLAIDVILIGAAAGFSS